MSFLDFFQRKSAQQAQLVLPSTIYVRKGMWVIYKGEPSIIADFNPINGFLEIHITDREKGETIAKEQIQDLTQLRQCKWSEIPAARRPDQIKAARLGYID